MQVQKMKIDTLIFDLGGVLIDWNPYYLYRKIFGTEEEIREFLGSVCTPEWNEEQDAGRTLSEGTELLVKMHPSHEPHIRAYYDRWEEMLGAPIGSTVEVLRKLKASGKYRLYALTNWSAETFPVALERFSFLHWFEGIVVSGTERTRKPFRKIFDILLERYQIHADQALLIDDSLRNIAGAKASGIHGIHFQSSVQLEKELGKFNILV